MTKKNLPPVEYLRKRLRYEPETGKLFWLDCEELPKEWRTKYSNKEAFTSFDGGGYKQGMIGGKKFRAHRVAWALNFDAWPDGEIDHINGSKDDNRIENLRCVDRTTQCRNMSMMKSNTSGFTGITLHELTKRWRAQCWLNNKNVHLGYFATLEEAIFARNAFCKENGFSERHGL